MKPDVAMEFNRSDRSMTLIYNPVMCDRCGQNPAKLGKRICWKCDGCGCSRCSPSVPKSSPGA